MKTKQRTLAVLLLLALLIGGLLWLVTRSNAAEEAASSAAAEGTIPLSNFAIGDLEQLQYIYGGETITLNYDSGSWTLADDPDYHLDTSACNTMATALASLNAKRQLTAETGEDYGLTDPAVTVTARPARLRLAPRTRSPGICMCKRKATTPSTPCPATRLPVLS